MARRKEKMRYLQSCVQNLLASSRVYAEESKS